MFQFIEEEGKEVGLWNLLSDEQYLQASQSFAFFDIKYEEPDPETEENGEEYQKREEELERLVKKNNQLEVANLLIVLATAMTNLGTTKNANAGK